MLVLAHRGANREQPENTLPAFRRAVELGADGVELDVHRTRDDGLVVRHDADGPAGLLPDLTLAEVAAALPDVPTLAAVLDVCAGLLVNVEIKNLPHEPGYDPGHRAADLVAALLAERGGADRVLVSSFDLDTVDRVHAVSPTVPTGWLTLRADLLDALAVAHDHGHRALHPGVWALAGDVAGEVVGGGARPWPRRERVDGERAGRGPPAR